MKAYGGAEVQLHTFITSVGTHTSICGYSWIIPCRGMMRLYLQLHQECFLPYTPNNFNDASRTPQSYYNHLHVCHMTVLYNNHALLHRNMVTTEAKLNNLSHRAQTTSTVTSDALSTNSDYHLVNLH